MEATNELYHDFRGMLEKAVWKKSKQYRLLERDEILSEAYCYFCEIARNYDPTRALFSTYLYRGLEMRLNQYCKKEQQKKYKTMSDKYDRNEEVSFKRFVQTIELADSILSLSDDARELLDFILGREWEIPGWGYAKISYHSVFRHYKNDWEQSRINDAWTELGQWWKKEAV